MSDSDLMDSKADVCVGATSSSGSSLSPRTPPNCARCKNHGLKITLKGHKRYCKYRCCSCEKCRLTSDRQKIMALQTSWRRAQAQDEARGLLMGEVPPIAPVSSFLHHPHLHHHHNNQTTKNEKVNSKDNSEPASALQPSGSLEGSGDSSSSPSSTSGLAPSTLVRKLTPIQSNGAHMPFVEDCKATWKSLKDSHRYHNAPRKYGKSGSAAVDFTEDIEEILPFDNVDWEFSSYLAFLTPASSKRRTYTSAMPSIQIEEEEEEINNENNPSQNVPLASSYTYNGSKPPKKDVLGENVTSLTQTVAELIEMRKQDRNLNVPLAPIQPLLENYLLLANLDRVLKKLPEDVVEELDLSFQQQALAAVRKHNPNQIRSPGF